VVQPVGDSLLSGRLFDAGSVLDPIGLLEPQSGREKSWPSLSP
jgi:hypothetical protein